MTQAICLSDMFPVKDLTLSNRIPQNGNHRDTSTESGVFRVRKVAASLPAITSNPIETVKALAKARALLLFDLVVPHG
jgi:hypothetical protein